MALCLVEMCARLSKFSKAAALLAGLLLITHGIPVAMNLSFVPPPGWKYTNVGYPKSDLPAYKAAADEFTFPHVDWSWRQLERKFILAGDLPLWNPYASLGIPFAAQYENQIFLPIEWIEIFGGPRLWNIFLIAKMLLAGLGAMLIVRNFCSSAAAIFAGGLVFAYSGYFLWLNTIPGFVNGAAATPWLFVAIISLFNEQSSTKRRAGQFALAIGFVTLTGQPQLIALDLLLGALLFVTLLIHAAIHRKQISEKVIIAFCGVAGGLAIAAPQLYSFATALENGYSLHTPGAYAIYGIGPLNFTISIWPFFFGQLMQSWEPSLFPEQINWETFPIVVGTGGLIVTIAGVFSLGNKALPSQGRAVLLAMILIAAFCLLIVVAGVIGYPIWKGPILDRINFARYVVPVLSLSIASICASGLESPPRTIRSATLVGTALLLCALVSVGLVMWPTVREIEFSQLLDLLTGATVDRAETPAIDVSYVLASITLGIAPSIVALLSIWIIGRFSTDREVARTSTAWSLVIVIAAEFTFFVRFGFGLSSELLRLIPVILICASAIAVVRSRHTVACGMILGALAGMVGILASAEHRLARIRDPVPAPTPHISFLQNISRGANSRILSGYPVMTGDVSNAYGISQLDSFNPIQIDRTARLIFELLASKKLDYTIPNAWWGMEYPSSDFPSWSDYFAHRSIYNLLAVEYLIDKPSGPLSKARVSSIEPVVRTPQVTIYRDLLAMPRAYFIDAVYRTKTFGESISMMRDSSFDPHSKALVEEATSSGVFNDAAIRDHGKVMRLKIKRLGSTRVDIQLDATAEGIAVLADASYPGWQAEVDGQERPIQIVNGIFRGVFVHPGDRMLTFTFWPKWLNTALLVAVLATIYSIVSLFGPMKVPFRGTTTIFRQLA